MTGIGLHTLLPLIGIRSALAHHEIMEMLEVLHALGNAYRLASSGMNLGAVYARFALGFCRAIPAVLPGALGSVLEAVASPSR
jgi:hypothetical protein